MGVGVSPPSAGRDTCSQNGMRRTSAPRVSRTKPLRSPSTAEAVVVAVRSSGPGTVTGVGATRLAPGVVAMVSTATSQEPGPPPASASVTWAVAVEPVGTSPNETEDGVASRSGTSALAGAASPPPPRVGGAGWLSTSTVVPVSINAALIVATGQSGWRSRRSAAAPEICGVAIEVPDIASQPPGTEERIETPGALTSGFSRSEIAVGPALENPATVERPRHSGSSPRPP